MLRALAWFWRCLRRLAVLEGVSWKAFFSS